MGRPTIAVPSKEEAIKKFFDWLPWSVGIIMSGIVVMNWLGARTETTTERLDKHMTTSAVVHDTVLKEIEHLHSMDEDFRKFQKAQIIGECLENDRKQLAIQELLPTCQKYGIQR